MPDALQGGHNLGFMFLPNYRAWVIVVSLAVCFATWFVIERTRLGAYLRAATENPTLVRAFGINVPRMITLTYGFGVALAALRRRAGGADLQVSPADGRPTSSSSCSRWWSSAAWARSSARSSPASALGVIEGLTKVFYPEASNTVIFVIMVIVLLVRPAGLFGRRA